MNSAQATGYVEAIAIYHKDINRKLEDLYRQHAENLSKYDPTASAALNQASRPQVKTLEITIDNTQVTINSPGLWLQVFQLACRRYGECYDQNALITITYRYVKGWNPTKVYVYQGISRRTYYNRRDDFLALFLLYAVQFRLLVLE